MSRASTLRSENFGATPRLDAFSSSFTRSTGKIFADSKYSDETYYEVEHNQSDGS